MADDFAATVAQHADSDLPEEHQIQAGQPVKGAIGNDHADFLQILFTLLDSGEINPDEPRSLIKQDVYESLSEEWQDKVDLSLSNMANQIRMIQKLRAAGDDEHSIHLQTMVEHLWEMKQRIEEHHDAFKF